LSSNYESQAIDEQNERFLVRQEQGLLSHCGGEIELGDRQTRHLIDMQGTRNAPHTKPSDQLRAGAKTSTPPPRLASCQFLSATANEMHRLAATVSKQSCRICAKSQQLHVFAGPPLARSNVWVSYLHIGSTLSRRHLGTV